MPNEQEAAAPATEKPKHRATRVTPCEGIRLHIMPDGADVWLNTEAGDYDGICIGVGTERDRAIDEAIRTLTSCLSALKKAKARG